MGEATITKVEFHIPEETVAKYGNRLFITKEELDNYRKRGGRPAEKKPMVLSLSNIKKYDNPIRVAKAVIMAGLNIRSCFQEFLRFIDS